MSTALLTHSAIKTWAASAWISLVALGCERPETPSAGTHEAQTSPGGYASIPAGSFVMGSPSDEENRDLDEGPTHQVTLTRSFWMKKTEVTQKEWRALMGDNPSDCEFGCSSDRPVNRVSWEDSLEYLNKLSEREGLERCYEKEDGTWSWPKGLDCQGYRLPTEAEWEYAARGGTTGARYGSLDSIAWYDGNSGGKTQPVGKKQANAYGLYDMLGSVWEWTWDPYGDYSGGEQTDPIAGGLVQGASAARVFRGCSWGSEARLCRAAFRVRYSPGIRYGYLGVRPARSNR